MPLVLRSKPVSDLKSIGIQGAKCARLFPIRYLWTLIALLVLASPQARADLLNNGTFTTDTTTGLDWLDLTQTVNMSFLDVSAQLAPGGMFAGWRYATVAEVEAFWADAGITGGESLPCSPAPCLDIVVPEPATENLINLIGNTWTPVYGIRGVIGLTSTLNTTACSIYTCYYTPEIRIFNEVFVPDQALVVEALLDYIADPACGSWLVRATSISSPFSVTIEVNVDTDFNSTTPAPATFNIDSEGAMHVAILGSPTFNVSTIDPTSVRFGPSGAPNVIPAFLQDVNDDGIPDLILAFVPKNAGFGCYDTVAVLSGVTYSKQPFSGSETVQTTHTLPVPLGVCPP
jgi:hypothetical protein